MEKIIRNIEVENEIFNSLSKQEKRVEVAKDVIVRIKKRTIIPTGGTFIDDDNNILLDVLLTNPETSLQEVILKNPKLECNACAKGGLFMSYITKVNKFNVCDLSDSSAMQKVDSRETKKLKEIFTLKQLCLIEQAFEGCDEDYRFYDDYSNFCTITPIVTISEKSLRKAHRFYEKYKTERTRLIGIMENIIENNGTFKP